MEGWICLYKKLINWEWYQDGNTCRLFIHLLLLANYEDKTWQGQLIKRGQLITSSEHLAKDLNLSRQQVRTAISKLKSTNEITTKSTNKYTLITIEKYEDYQSKTDKSNQQRNQQYDNQITTTNNITNKQKLNKTKLNYLYLYIKDEKENFEGLSDVDKMSIQTTLKRLGLFIEDDTYLPEKMKFELQIKYYAVTQLYLSSYKLYLKDLTDEQLTFNYLQSKKYCPIENEDKLEDFMNYYIVCLRKDLKNETNK